MKEKDEIRQSVLARRDLIAVSEREYKSNLICESLLVEVRHAYHVSLQSGQALGKAKPLANKTIAVYAAMRSEVSLDHFIHAAYNFGARLCFPCMIRTAPTSVSRETLCDDQRFSAEFTFENVNDGERASSCPPVLSAPEASVSRETLRDDQRFSAEFTFDNVNSAE